MAFLPRGWFGGRSCRAAKAGRAGGLFWHLGGACRASYSLLSADATHGTGFTDATHGTCFTDATHGTGFTNAAHGTGFIDATHGTGFTITTHGADLTTVGWVKRGMP
ncbi:MULTISPECIES: hypothetical protein [Achromobacter]|uniref:Uncharacterized protein n=1 Tax=Achromobacter spanius TaxID=217203 RepID=A0ABY8GVZ0_9BURK|nr:MULTISPECIES: hypothetical protein [Achromobacter]WAI82072.1 hypothetical protein N8Z00_21415 [Achromobacter spanius]WEX92160.1 hypothetical protein N3Z32_16025 [Achromobacter sp. SS2-2022]WFP08693.1 hypothetical protein P8T11_02105 [Achromobacter spanius]